MSSTNIVATPESLLRQEVLDLKAYPVPNSAGMVKLDAMENPYLLPQSLREEIARLVADAAINRYPDADAQQLKASIRAVIGLPQSLDILLGNGSDEIIQLLALAVAKPDATLLSVEPSFVMYRMIATFTGMQYVGVPLTEDFALNLPAVLAAMQHHRPALVFLSYPNNPTGNLFDAEVIAQIIEAAPGLVIVDEAYYAFANASLIPMLTCYPNLLVMRTFSKLGMAGLRLGFLVGSKAWIAQLEKLRLPYNVSVLTQLVAEKLLRHHDVLLLQSEQIKQDRVWLYERLVGVADVRPYVSNANFILFRVMHADKIFNELKKRGVLIKNLNKAHPLLVDCLRVTVGTPLENEQFIQALQESIHQFN
ncbi:Histidinol-phosphate aminotransferase 1 [Candidatus Nitrotoga sp. BS]|uniref:histidinol-phosphate transaminase n=1 Tax=Candidatus Nitrotoga sp. BS TaxID=2890408 RepID=UPI001EF3AD36|nr:histidinol-phosphate transaminase [Candidatus Nitrotoga sp. BS]CAH1199399.1 Histidinol-phosphate aminotransferase 1 [Candidatus Nitrotoga sp. BS]